MFRYVKEEKNFGIKKGVVLLSNSIEVLFEHLKVNLFSENHCDDPFAERLVIVPSSGIQQWVQTQMATSLGISCGYTSTFLNKGINILREKLFYTQKKWMIPSEMELFLLIEQAIGQAENTADPIWRPLLEYIGKKERRKRDLISLLVKHFIRYGIYANQVSLEWEKAPKQWQEALWSSIFSTWQSPFKAFADLQKRKESLGNLSLHLFAFSHLSAFHLNFFYKTAELVPVYFYQLSPCQEFWGDALENVPLLRAFGKVGQKMARLLEDAPLDIEEAYLVFGGQTQLKQVQRMLLTLEPQSEVLDDDSIQIHVSATPHREIENLHETIASILAKEKCEPKDIIVMAPQITHYAPYIEAVFGQERSGIDYQIADMPIESNDPQIKGLSLLFDLDKRRWNTTSILNLFNFKPFQKKQNLNEEDICQIKKWARLTGIRWGVDGEHRASLLRTDYCDNALEEPNFTWLEGMGCLVKELSSSPLDQGHRIEFSQAELLGQTITLIRSLLEDVTLLKLKKTLASWSQSLNDILEKYFFFSEKSSALSVFFEKLHQAEKHFTDVYAFSNIQALLEEATVHETVTIHRTHCQAVRFCSLQPMRAIPARVICFIGMNYDAFPRKEEHVHLDLLKNNPLADYAPSRTDFDRHLFLEGILSAREKIIISYQGQDPYDLTEIPPSSVITELLPYISPQQIYKHPIHKTEHLYFKPLPHFCIKIEPTFSLPTGEFVIDAKEFSSAARTPLSQYLYNHNLKIYKPKDLEEEEDFILTPLQSHFIRKLAITQGQEQALKIAKSEGLFPPALFGELAYLQCVEELKNIPETSFLEIKPFSFSLTPQLTVIFTGKIPGVYQNGLCAPHSANLKSAIKCWPHFLLLNTLDSEKKNLHFVFSQMEKNVFFEDPKPLLNHYLYYYFYTRMHPLPLTPEWIEGILKKDIKKLQQAPIYDELVEWQTKGKEIDYIQIMEECSDFVDKIYKEMADAWF